MLGRDGAGGGTTVAQPKNALGREAMSMLIELLADPNVPPRKRVLSADLIVRASAAPPNLARRKP